MKQQPLSQSPSTSLPSWWVLAWHRALHCLGWPGILGLGLMGLSVVEGVTAWQARQDFLAVEAQAPQRQAQPGAAALRTGTALRAAVRAADTLPLRDDIHALMAQIQEEAARRQLAWEAADYRLKAATADGFARLEVHGSVKGAYRPMRLWLNQLRTAMPDLMLREASFTRPHPDTAEVDAKLVLVVPLGQDSSSGGTAIPSGARP